MVQDVEASIRFHEGQVELFSEGYAFALANANHPLLAFNARQVFASAAACGLMLWRKGDDPTRWIGKAIDSALSCLDELLKVGAEQHALLELPVEKMAFLSFLLGRSIDFVSTCPASPAPDVALDLKLLELLSGSGDAAILARDIEAFAKKKRHALSAESYRCYLTILGSARQGVSIDEAVDAAESCYARRAKDSFFSGAEEMEGGGAGNARMVDYRLACILKKTGYSGSSPHAWRW